MGFKSYCLVCLALVLAFSCGINGLDVTKLLSQYPDLSQFSKYLTETKLAEQINSRSTLTILALGNSAISSLSNKPQDTIKAILSTHVILDYYDEKKLVEAIGAKTQLVTLYQTSGLATGKQGFIYANLINEGEVAFGSAVDGSPFDSKLVKTVVTQPFTIAILQVTQPIIAPGIEGKSNSKAPAPSTSTTKPTSPVAKSPAPSTSKPPASASNDGAETPAPSTSTSTAPTPAEETTATAPAAAPVPAAAPAADADQASPPSGSSRTQMGFVALLLGFASLFVAL